MLVTKYNGEKVSFDEAKLKRSLENAGARPEHVKVILQRVEEDMYDGKTTAKLYSEAFRNLKRLSWASAARFNLKKSIMRLGPSGFPFEKFVAELFKYQGFDAINNVTYQGKCVSHEVDVQAVKEDEVWMVECKFHNRQGMKSDVKVAMYFKSRVEDIQEGEAFRSEFGNKPIIGALATNTRFSGDAITFAKCRGIALLSWDHPEHGSLKNRIELSGLYPITCLNGLTRKEKQSLLDSGIVMAKTLLKDRELLKPFRLSKYRMNNLIQELEELCSV